MKQRSDVDEITKQAQALLFFRHMDRISQAMCNPKDDAMHLDAEVIHAETIVAYQLDEDKDYQQEMADVKAKYAADKRPGALPPDVWHRERRQMELRAMFKAACARGVLSHKGVPFLDDPL